MFRLSLLGPESCPRASFANQHPSSSYRSISYSRHWTSISSFFLKTMPGANNGGGGGSGSSYETFEIPDFTFASGAKQSVKIAYQSINPTSTKGTVLIPTCFGGRINTTLTFTTGALREYHVVVVAMLGNGESSSPSNDETFPRDYSLRYQVRFFFLFFYIFYPSSLLMTSSMRLFLFIRKGGKKRKERESERLLLSLKKKTSPHYLRTTSMPNISFSPAISGSRASKQSSVSPWVDNKPTTGQSCTAPTTIPT